MLKIGLSGAMYLLGPKTSVLLFALYLFLTRALATATFSLFNIILSELIDEDVVLYRRSAPQSSSFFGLNALVTKPAQSIAPMLAVALWSQYGFRETKQNAAAGEVAVEATSVHATNPILASPQSEQLQYVIFLCCTLGPMFTGALQALAWRFYTLHSAQLVDVKRRLHALNASRAAKSNSAGSVELGQASLLGEDDGAVDDEHGTLLGDKRRMAHAIEDL